MYFNNPDIIENDTDVILGSINVDEETINFKTFIHQTKYFYAYHIRKDIESLVGENNTHKKALELTAKKIYSRLDMYEQIIPIDEEHLAELMMQSRNYETWQSDMKRRFLNVHSGITQDDTQISISKSFSSESEGLSQDEIKAIKKTITLDLILEKLSMYLDIDKPSNN